MRYSGMGPEEVELERHYALLESLNRMVWNPDLIYARQLLDETKKKVTTKPRKKKV